MIIGGLAGFFYAHVSFVFFINPEILCIVYSCLVAAIAGLGLSFLFKKEKLKSTALAGASSASAFAALVIWIMFQLNPDIP